jgi:hypothetical protein
LKNLLHGGPDLGKNIAISHMSFCYKNHTCLLQKKPTSTISNKNHGETCPWRIRSCRFRIIDHESGSLEPTGTGEDSYEPIPAGLSSSWAKKDLKSKTPAGCG